MSDEPQRQRIAARPVGDAGEALGHLERCRERLVPWLLGLFLALGPVYWLPGVAEGLLRTIEWMLILPVLGIVFATELREARRPFPRGVLGPWGFAGLAVLWIPGLVRAVSFSHAVDFLTSLGSYCAIFWCLYCLARRDSRTVWAVFGRAFGILAVFAGLTLVNEIPGIGLWETEGRWAGGWFGGFSHGYTGWSVALALFLPMSALAFVVSSQRRAPMWRLLSVLGALAVVCGQLGSGGRSGIAASLFTVVVLLLVVLSPKKATGLVLVLLLGLGLVFAGRTGRDSHGIYDPAESSEVSIVAVASLDNLSTRRIAGYFLGVQALGNSPVMGHGLRQCSITNPFGLQIEIHNLWLKWAVYAGPLPPLLLLFMCAAVVKAGWSVRRDRCRPEEERNGAAMFLMVVSAGLLLSFLEPSIPFGVHISSVWWAAAGSLTGLAGRASQAADSADSDV